MPAFLSPGASLLTPNSSSLGVSLPPLLLAQLPPDRVSADTSPLGGLSTSLHSPFYPMLSPILLKIFYFHSTYHNLCLNSHLFIYWLVGMWLVLVESLCPAGQAHSSSISTHYIKGHPHWLPLE